MRVLVTGSAGFIGFHLCRRLLADGHDIVGLDGMTDYYDPALKRARHASLMASNHFQAHEMMLEDETAVMRLVQDTRADIVVHLAAQAGVRYSLEAPRSYIDSNIIGTFNLLEALRNCPAHHFLMASTSSVYGANAVPFAEKDRTDHQLSFYAATKRATEAMAHSYSHMWNQPTSVMRFFTVYGPWGRPDMALFKFTRAILEGQPIDVYNNGQMQRDFTYVDDCIEGIMRLLPLTPVACDAANGSPAAPWRVINIAGGRLVELNAYIAAIEKATGRTALRHDMPIQPGESQVTLAAMDELEKLTGFRPQTTIEDGVRAFVDWYRDFYKA
jgi:UDP-glucuronate 4-epimerase